MFTRKIEQAILNCVASYKAIALIGPRQSGKTTLARTLFNDHRYITLEDIDTRTRAQNDPRGFLQSIDSDVILDEIQNVPDILSYLQSHLDNKEDKRQFILTGSNSLKLMDSISQSLAGRIRIFHLLPLELSELPTAIKKNLSLDQMLFNGLYPRIYDEKLEPSIWYADYYATYIEKDVRKILNVDNLNDFDRFVRLCAGRVGQLVNHSSLSNDVGTSSVTIKKWMNVLQASFICHHLQPHFKNFSKRLIKSPKYYFNDTGLLCYLLRIKSAEQLNTHPLRGQIFENWVFNQFQKMAYNKGEESALYFWRDKSGHEVDFVIDRSTYLELFEVKSSATFHESFLKNLKWLGTIQQKESGTVIYAGDDSFTYQEFFKVISWKEFN